MLSCLDENGNPVDSWVSLAQNKNYKYYWHSDANGFVKSIYNLTQTLEGNIMATISQLYADDLDLDNVAWSLYNDDPPPPEDTASSTYAHAKGVLMTNDRQGFWLVHSKPNWPAARSTGAVPFPDTQHSQSLMCITLNVETFNSIAKANMVNYPYIYDSFISANMATIIPSFAEWITGGRDTSTTNMTNVFTSVNNVPYIQYAKSKAWGKDLYEDLVAPGLGRNLNVETWRLGSGGRMSSVCNSGEDDTWEVHPTIYDVIEVAEVSMPDGESWLGTQDHSKWVSTIDDGSESAMYVCVGDINRMCSQESRGGGTVCVSNSSKTLWASFNQSITDVEDCWAYNPCDGTSSKCYWCPAPDPTRAPSPFPTSITPAPTGTPYSAIIGDVAIILFNTDNPDMFSAVSLFPITPGTKLKFTDDGWTGTAFRGGEGIVSFAVTSTIPAGYVWTYAGPGSIDPYGTWLSESGSFSLSTDSDQIFVYIGDETDPTFLFGLSTSPWTTDGSDIGTTDSVCPEQLIGNTVPASVAFSKVDNGRYNNSRVGTKEELLSYICDPLKWETSDDDYYTPNESLFTVFFVTDTPTISPGSSSSGSDAAYGILGESGFIGIFIAGSVLIVVCVAFLIWRYIIRVAPLSHQDEQRNSNVEISDSGHKSEFLKT